MLKGISTNTARRMATYLEKGLWIFTAFLWVISIWGLVTREWMEAIPFLGGAVGGSLVVWDFRRVLGDRVTSRAVPWLAFVIVVIAAVVPYSIELAREHRLLEPVRKCVSSRTEAHCARARAICDSYEVLEEAKPEICERMEEGAAALR